ncbi:hypothetical protein TREMEDRAFT_62268 [Tremella mesenterica DSM 1558]|uniref:uncharacterized protein n=1 Tax=Tremella mesenterica (strain ATCC 24925 / CBS 8224 / DSM 1558 / NBRC 9311 / NRRL Y-6157 / RJB 2259-6 / UBC 559-6) TaxID=578456 RepID=UPI0003F49B20|nr:uncharacterized protein TREMEDRAFT_62268 [Tremella mesenterica DSM 1558]EIW69403.1 hypothetical protein TREMEDRAFT_62268 [Tremella mesenterica DSM 1558]
MTSHSRLYLFDSSTKLPVEIINRVITIIADKNDTTTLTVCQRVNKAMYARITPLLYTNIVIDSKRKYMKLFSPLSALLSSDDIAKSVPVVKQEGRASENLNTGGVDVTVANTTDTNLSPPVFRLCDDSKSSAILPPDGSIKEINCHVSDPMKSIKPVDRDTKVMDFTFVSTAQARIRLAFALITHLSLNLILATEYDAGFKRVDKIIGQIKFELFPNADTMCFTQGDPKIENRRKSSKKRRISTPLHNHLGISCPLFIAKFTAKHYCLDRSGLSSFNMILQCLLSRLTKPETLTIHSPRPSDV